MEVTLQTIVRPFSPVVTDSVVEQIKEYRQEIVLDYYAALQARHFVILAGPPGVDKIGLAWELARSLARQPDWQWCLLQAHPWWTADTGNMAGLSEVHERFNALKILDFLETAKANEALGRPFFVGIEGMSPHEVQCYFQDLPGGLLWQIDAHPLHVDLPGNLYVTGTVDVAAEAELGLSPSVCQAAACIWLDHESSPGKHKVTWNE